MADARPSMDGRDAEQACQHGALLVPSMGLGRGGQPGTRGLRFLSTMDINSSLETPGTRSGLR